MLGWVLKQGGWRVWLWLVSDRRKLWGKCIGGCKDEVVRAKMQSKVLTASRGVLGRDRNSGGIRGGCIVVVPRVCSLAYIGVSPRGVSSV